MIVDNCPAYLSNVTIKFLLLNATSVLQPLDQGIAVADSKNFQSITKFFKSVNVPDVVLWIANTWCEVNPESVTKCFDKADFMVNC